MGNERERQTKEVSRRGWWLKESETAVCALVVSTRPYIQPPLRLIGLQRVRWVVAGGGV